MVIWGVGQFCISTAGLIMLSNTGYWIGLSWIALVGMLTVHDVALTTMLPLYIASERFLVSWLTIEIRQYLTKYVLMTMRESEAVLVLK